MYFKYCLSFTAWFAAISIKKLMVSDSGNSRSYVDHNYVILSLSQWQTPITVMENCFEWWKYFKSDKTTSKSQKKLIVASDENPCSEQGI